LNCKYREIGNLHWSNCALSQRLRHLRVSDFTQREPRDHIVNYWAVRNVTSKIGPCLSKLLYCIVPKVTLMSAACDYLTKNSLWARTHSCWKARPQTGLPQSRTLFRSIETRRHVLDKRRAHDGRTGISPSRSTSTNMAYLTILGLGLTVLSWRALTSPLRGVRQLSSLSMARLSVRASSKTTLA
jgi:hypothetical protein